MTQTQEQFEIADTKSVDDNLAVFAADISIVDAPLATVLTARIGEWSRGKPVQHAELLDALLAVIVDPEGDLP